MLNKTLNQESFPDSLTNCPAHYYLIRSKKSPLGYRSCRPGCRRKPPWSTVWAPPTWRPTRPATIERHNNEQCWQMNKTPSFNQWNPAQCCNQWAHSFMTLLCFINISEDTPASFACRVLVYGLLTGQLSFPNPPSTAIDLVSISIYFSRILLSALSRLTFGLSFMVVYSKTRTNENTELDLELTMKLNSPFFPYTVRTVLRNKRISQTTYSVQKYVFNA